MVKPVSSQPLHRPTNHPPLEMGWRVLIVVTTTLLASCSVLSPSITPQEQEQLAKQDQEEIFKGQQVLAEPLTLYEAMARAIKYNLDLRLKRMEESVARNEEDLSQQDLLPKLLVNAGYSSRTGNTGSVSQSLTTGITAQDPTISRATTNGTTDLTMSWNLLDFGVSYYQARQKGNQRFIQAEQRRKAAHNLIKDVRFAFWKAASAQWLEREIITILQAAEGELTLARKVENEGLRSPVHALQFQLGLLDTVRQLEKTQTDLAIAKDELAALINLEPGVSFKLCDNSGEMVSTLELNMSVDEMERMALSLRPELRIEHYQARIEADETRKEMARLFPGLEFNVSESFDNNTFLVYQHWAQAGARLSWSLLRTLNGKSQLDLANNREQVVQIRRQVLHMAILSQVRIALHEYRAARNALQRVVMENNVRHRLQNNTAFRSELGLDSQFSYVQTVATAALGHIQRYEAYARYQNALGRIYVTLGLNPIGEQVLNWDIPHLTRSLRENDLTWQTMILSDSTPSPLTDTRLITPFSLSELAQIGVDPTGQVKQDLPVQSLAAPISQPTVTPTDAGQIVTFILNPPRQFAVQVDAMNLKGIELRIAQLEAKGYHPLVNPIKTADGGNMGRIWIGRYEKKEEATAALDAYLSKEQRPAFIQVITE